MRYGEKKCQEHSEAPLKDVLSDTLFLKGMTFSVTKATVDVSSGHLQVAAEKLVKRNIGPQAWPLVLSSRLKKENLFRT